MNYMELEQVIKDSGMKKYAIADKIGVHRATFYLKLSGEREFTQGELLALKNVLNLSDGEFLKIFFDRKVGKMPTRT